MKKKLMFSSNYLVILLLFFAVSRSNAGGECWYLEMPKMHGEFLIKESVKSDDAKYKEIMAKIPALIEKGTVTELEACIGKKGNNEHSLSGKNKPFFEKKLDATTIYQGSRYKDYKGDDEYDKRAGWGHYELNNRESGEAQPFKDIKTTRIIGKSWNPTFARFEGEKCQILFERDSASKRPRSVVKSTIECNLRFPDKKDTKLIWLLPIVSVSDHFDLVYRDMEMLKVKQGEEWTDYWGIDLELVNVVRPDLKNQKMFKINCHATHQINNGFDYYEISFKEWPKMKYPFICRRFKKGVGFVYKDFVDDEMRGEMEMKFVSVLGK
jgi:hypothetical protein